MKTKIKPEHLTLMINNINSLSLKKDSDFLRKGLNAGCYNSEENSITIKEGKIDLHVLYHELLHMASTVEYMGKYNCGFDNYNYLEDNYIGYGLNEGYTDHLVSFLTGEENEITEYNYLEKVTRAIEFIIGAEEMQKCYFSASLQKLAVQMSKYASAENITKLINYTDYYYNFAKKMRNKKNFPADKVYLNNICTEINYILIEMYRSKLNYENKYSDQLLTQFASTLPNGFSLAGKRYNFGTDVEQSIENQGLSL
jgi:hypothetical protein